jgi:hypothetical protein
LDVSVIGSGASHRYGTIGDQTLYLGVLTLAAANFCSCAQHIGAGGGASGPLIKGLPSIRAWEGGLGPL